jgi:hypothetical protein
MKDTEYLVSYGRSGDFGRFRPAAEDVYRRGDPVVVHSPQGVEVGTVLCPVTPGHGRYLSRTALGQLLRRVSAEDERTAEQRRAQAQRLFEDGRRLAAELDLPLEILDAEVLLDGQQGVLQYVGREVCDYRPLVSALSRRHDLLIVLQNLALPAEPAGDGPGCGRPDCGQAGGGGCTSCGTGGGCTSCGKATRKEDVAALLAGLGRPSEGRARTPLL